MRVRGATVVISQKNASPGGPVRRRQPDPGLPQFLLVVSIQPRRSSSYRRSQQSSSTGVGQRLKSSHGAQRVCTFFLCTTRSSKACGAYF